MSKENPAEDEHSSRKASKRMSEAGVDADDRAEQRSSPYAERREQPKGARQVGYPQNSPTPTDYDDGSRADDHRNSDAMSFAPTGRAQQKSGLSSTFDRMRNNGTPPVGSVANRPHSRDPPSANFGQRRSQHTTSGQVERRDWAKIYGYYRAQSRDVRIRVGSIVFSPMFEVARESRPDVFEKDRAFFRHNVADGCGKGRYAIVNNVFDTHVNVHYIYTNSGKGLESIAPSLHSDWVGVAFRGQESFTPHHGPHKPLLVRETILHPHYEGIRDKWRPKSNGFLHITRLLPILRSQIDFFYVGELEPQSTLWLIDEYTRRTQLAQVHNMVHLPGQRLLPPPPPPPLPPGSVPPPPSYPPPNNDREGRPTNRSSTNQSVGSMTSTVNHFYGDGSRVHFSINGSHGAPSRHGSASMTNASHSAFSNHGAIQPNPRKRPSSPSGAIPPRSPKRPLPPAYWEPRPSEPEVKFVEDPSQAHLPVWARRVGAGVRDVRVRVPPVRPDPPVRPEPPAQTNLPAQPDPPAQTNLPTQPAPPVQPAPPAPPAPPTQPQDNDADDGGVE